MTITMTTRNYSRTASGKGWKKNPDSTETETISRENYNNRADRDALRFWNGFCGGTCRAEYGYTRAGYLPIKISRVNPAGTLKIVETFRFS